jgi:carbonic anhydrase
MRNEITAIEALKNLKLGNFRFANNMSINQNLMTQVKVTKDKQEPFAAILSCMDSRVSSELIFDLGIGDVFSLRIAGNIVTEGILGSLEYATGVVGTNLIVILGHTNCGAIKGACDQVKYGNLTGLLNKIQPAIDQVTDITGERNSTNKAFVDQVTENNVKNCVHSILEHSPVIKELIESGDVGIVTGIYDVSTGKITFDVENALIKHDDLVAAATVSFGDQFI